MLKNKEKSRFKTEVSCSSKDQALNCRGETFGLRDLHDFGWKRIDHAIVEQTLTEMKGCSETPSEYRYALF